MRKVPLWQLASEALDNLIVRHDFTQMELVFEVQIIAAALERLKELEQQCQTS